MTLWLVAGVLVLYVGAMLCSPHARRRLRLLAEIPDAYPAAHAFLILVGGYVVYAVGVALVVALTIAVLWFLEA